MICTTCGKERVRPATLAYIESAIRERMERVQPGVRVLPELMNTLAEIHAYHTHVVADAKAKAPVDPLLL